MGFIIDFVDFLISTIRTVWDFFIQTVNELISFVKIIVSSIGIFTSTISTLPSWLKMFGVVTLGVCIAYLLVGRDAGKSN